MWWLTAIADGFETAGDSTPQLTWFRIVLAVAILYKFGYEHLRGAWRYFDPDCYVRYRYDREHPRLTVGTIGYRGLYLVKWTAAIALLAGVQPSAAAAALAVWFWFERMYDWKFHTTYLGLCSLFLASGAVFGEVFAHIVLVLLTVQMYASSAWRKLRSRHFTSGAALHAFTRSMQDVREAQRYRETWYPALMVRRLIEVPADVGARRWRPAAWATIALEVMVPVGLTVPFLFPYAVVAGCLMHLAFTAVLPVRLIPFSLATVGSYMLFLDPSGFGA